MTRQSIVTGIDLGTSNIRVVVAKYGDEGGMPTIIGTGRVESRGLRHGYIVNEEEAAASIREAVLAAEKTSGIKIKRAFVAIGGVSLDSSAGVGSVFISRADNEVSEADVKKATEAAEESTARNVNKEIVHSIPIHFKIDGEELLGHPVGMKGTRMEVKMLFITCLRQHLNEFIHAVETAGVRVEDIMASPLAASFATLTKRQKTAGCVLANIGGETLSVVVFEDNIPISLKIFPIGGMEITNDIALGLKIPLEEAEEVKRGKGMGNYPKKKLEDIMEARLSDIFDIIESHLKKIGKNGLLPAGIILTGGNAAIPLIEEQAKISLRLPSQVAVSDFAKHTKGQIIDTTWAVSYGLCIMGIDGETEEGASTLLARKAKGNIIAWIKQFLP